MFVDGPFDWNEKVILGICKNAADYNSFGVEKIDKTCNCPSKSGANFLNTLNGKHILFKYGSKNIFKSYLFIVAVFA